MTMRHDPMYVQSLPQAVSLLSTSYPAAYRILPHTHARDQLLYAVTGTMWIRTSNDAWIVPPDRALYMPKGVEHSVAMRGPVEMRSLYIARDQATALPTEPVVFSVSDLLRALVLALLEEPLTYGANSRADRIAALILDEIARAMPLALSFPMPQDRRLQRLCDAVIDDPSSELTLEAWADRAGASRRTISRLFVSECGMTFGEWRQRVRLHHAVGELTRGKPVSCVARESGYRSPSAFSAAFRSVLGISPRDLRSDAILTPAASSPAHRGSRATAAGRRGRGR